MKNSARVMTAIASVGVLGSGWALGTAKDSDSAEPSVTQPETSATQTRSATGGSAPATGSSSSSSTTTAATSGGASRSGTFTGPATKYRYGTITVSVTLDNGRITDVQASANVNDHESPRYNSRAFPALRTAVLSANGADVETVSGATLTSKAYRTSLQAALDQAK